MLQCNKWITSHHGYCLPVNMTTKLNINLKVRPIQSSGSHVKQIWGWAHTGIHKRFDIIREAIVTMPEQLRTNERHWTRVLKTATDDEFSIFSNLHNKISNTEHQALTGEAMTQRMLTRQWHSVCPRIRRSHAADHKHHLLFRRLPSTEVATLPSGCPYRTVWPGRTANLKLREASKSKTIVEPRLKSPNACPFFERTPPRPGLFFGENDAS